MNELNERILVVSLWTVYSSYYLAITTTTSTTLMAMMNMRAIVYDRHGQPVWADPQLPRPTLSQQSSSSWFPRKHNHASYEQQLVIRVTAVGVNPVDAKGVIGDKIPHSWTKTQAFFKRSGITNRIIGFDFSGVVVEVDNSNNTNDSSFQVGDTVCGILPPSRYKGTMTEYIQISSRQVSRIDNRNPHNTNQTKNHLDEPSWMQQYAALPLVGITCLQCLQGAGWGQTQTTNSNNNNTPAIPTLLVLGASGGTGHMAIQIGRAMMMTMNNTNSDDNSNPDNQQQEPSYTTPFKIVAVCSERNRDMVQDLMTDNKKSITSTTSNNEHSYYQHVVLDYRSPDFVQALEREGPYSVIMDCVSSGDPRDQAGTNYQELLLSSSSRFVKDNHYEYRRLGGTFTDWMRAGCERLTGISMWKNPHAKLFWIQMHDTAPLLQQLVAWMRNGHIRGPLVSQTCGFSPQGVQQAFDALNSRRAVGKVVVALSTDTKEDEEENDKKND